LVQRPGIIPRRLILHRSAFLHAYFLASDSCWCTSRKLVHTSVQVGNLYIRVYKSETCTYESTSRKLVHTRVQVGNLYIREYKSETCTYESTSLKHIQ
ncbi:MAG: hypothetical protein WCY66_06565, partial [Candidatus Cloacimonadales bacterium]